MWFLFIIFNKISSFPSNLYENSKEHNMKKITNKITIAP